MLRCRHMRTYLTFPERLMYKLKGVLVEAQKSLTAFVVAQIEKAVTAREQAQIHKTYKALDSMIGLGPKGPTDTASTIDETLYGGKKGHGAISMRSGFDGIECQSRTHLRQTISRLGCRYGYVLY